MTKPGAKPIKVFWMAFGVLNGIAILVMLGMIVWAFFDIHNRLPFAQMSMIPCLLMMAIREIFK